MAITIRLLIYALTVLSHVGAGSDDDDHHVVLGPVENVTEYFIGPTSIVVAWDPPPVYYIHDIVGGKVDQESPGVDLIVSRHQNNITPTNGSASESNVVSSVAPDSVVVNHRNGTETTEPTPSSISECKPITFFYDYAVEMKQELDINDPSMVIAFKDSIQKHELHTVMVTQNTIVVDFSKGCVSRYVVSCQEEAANASVFSVSVPPTSNTATISDLKPGTRYKIVVTVVYVSGDKFENEPAVYFTTKSVNESKECSCDMYGAINPNQACNYSGSNYCNCQPGYEGSFCEMCAHGYYRTAPHFPCHRCPCDVHSGRKSACWFIEGFLKCESCEIGYRGNLCHDCDSGFYRYNRHCVPCFCNGNTPKNAPRMCKPTTGECISCQYNTTGFSCEQCMVGYIGDAINFKNCTKKDEVLVRSFKSSAVPSGVVAALVITFLLIILLIAAVVFFKRHYYKVKLRAFWTIEMKKDREDVDFSSVHNDDVRLEDADDIDYFSKRVFTPSSNKYSRLHEEM